MRGVLLLCRFVALCASRSLPLCLTASVCLCVPLCAFASLVPLLSCLSCLSVFSCRSVFSPLAGICSVGESQRPTQPQKWDAERLIVSVPLALALTLTLILALILALTLALRLPGNWYPRDASLDNPPTFLFICRQFKLVADHSVARRSRRRHAGAERQRYIDERGRRAFPVELIPRNLFIRSLALSCLLCISGSSFSLNQPPSDCPFCPLPSAFCLLPSPISHLPSFVSPSPNPNLT